MDEREEGVWSSCCKAGTERRQKEEREKRRERTRVRVQSDFNRDVLQSMGSPLEIVLNVSPWNHKAGLSFCS